jgi:coenzyme F420 hydrogenase subunit beta
MPFLEQREKVIGLTRLKLRACEVCDKFCELSCSRLTDMTPHQSLNMVSARTATITQSGDTNEIIKSILVGARSAERIDGVILLDLDPWTLEPVARIATSVHDIVSGIGMQYLWAPVLSKLNEAIFDRGLENLAIVGPPCVAEGARRLKETENPRLWPYQEAIRFTISRFCAGIYMPQIIPELLEGGLGLSRQDIRELTTSIPDGTLTVTSWDDEQRTIPLTEVEQYTRHGCGCCTDYLGESADIAVGRLGAEPDHATLITRTPVGEAIYQIAVRFNLLEVKDQVDEKALNAARAEKDRRTRAKALDELHILLLEALGDPKKQAHVRNCFVKLFGAPQGADKARRKVDVSCSGC